MIPDLDVWTNSKGDVEIHFYPPLRRDKWIIGFSTEFYTTAEMAMILRIKGWEVTQEMIDEVLKNQ